jgi:tetratricopeptide (TPR) repeat protein
MRVVEKPVTPKAKRWREMVERAWLNQYDGPGGQDLATAARQAADAAGDTIGQVLADIVIMVYEARYGSKPVSLEAIDTAERLFAEYAFTAGQIRAIFLRGFVLSAEGKYAESCSAVGKAFILMASRGDVLPVDAFMIYNSYYFNSVESGGTEDAYRFAHRALAAARELGSPAHLALMLSNLGSAHHESGNYEDALVMLTEALQLIQTASLNHMAPLIVGNLGMCQLAMEDYDGAWESISPYLDLVERQAFTRGSEKAFFEAIAAHTFAKRGDYTRSEVWIQRALIDAVAQGEIRIQAHCHWVQGLIEQGRGNHHQALKALQRAEALTANLHDPFYPTEIERALSEAYATSGDFEQAYIHIRRHIKLLGSSTAVATKARMQATQAQFELAETERERDYARKQQSDTEKARQTLESLNTELKAKIERYTHPENRRAGHPADQRRQVDPVRADPDQTPQRPQAGHLAKRRNRAG